MNILHISSASTWRGGERQVLYLIDRLQSNGVSNFLMSPKKSILSKRANLNSSQILELKKGIFSLVKNVRSLKKYCDLNKIDLIHGHDSHAHTLLWISYRFGGLQTKSLITRRLLFPIKNRSINKYNYPKIEKIISISEAVQNVLKPSIKDHSRLALIHSAIDTTSSSLNVNQNEVQNQDFVVGYVAAFTEEKDHKTFIETANYLLENYPQIPFKFVLAGSGSLLENIKKGCYKIKDRIEFKGFVEDVDQVYSQMNLLLHTSKYEALGTSILDAMKFNLPIISTKVGGIPEIVIEGKNGYLFNIGDYKSMGDQIYKIASDNNLYELLASNNPELLANFDVQVMIQKHLKLYSEIK